MANFDFLRRWCAWARGRNKHPTIVDVGANEGDFSNEIMAQLPNARIHAFEPNPPTFGRLSERFAGADNIVLNNCALSSSKGVLTLFDQEGREGTGRASVLQHVFDRIYCQNARSVEVEAVCLHNYVVDHRIDSIDYLKIDAEGAEQSILQGAAELIGARRIGVVQIENNIHNALTGFSFARLAQIFEVYAVYRLVPAGVLKIKGVAPYHVASSNELSKYCNYVAIDPAVAREMRLPV